MTDDDCRNLRPKGQVNTMGTQAEPHDDDMPAEIDFSKGVRGKFFKPVTSASAGLP